MQSSINWTCLGKCLWWETWLWVFWPFPFLFLFNAGQKSHQRKRFWLVIKKGTTSCVANHGFLSFLSWLWQSCMFIHTLSGPNTFLYIFFCFLPILIGNFLFLLLSSDLWLGTFFFCCFLPIFDRRLSFPFAFEAHLKLNSERIFSLGRSFCSFFQGQG